MRALVVDDSRTMRSILAGILRQLGFEVVEAGNGREGIERLAGPDKPALALVDWHMPEMSGLEFVRAVRGDRGHDGLRVVLVSGETDAAQVATARAAGADDYVTKPFTRDVIREKLTLLGLGPR